MALRKNQIVIMGRAAYRVAMVNDCRARLTPIIRPRTTDEGDEKAAPKFELGGQAVSVSPESDLPTMRIVTEAAAREAGYRSLTHEYDYNESNELGRAWAQLAFDSIPAVAVFYGPRQRFTLWRKF